MIANEHNDATTTDTDQSHLHLALGVRKLKIFAGIQIGLGVACITACIIGIIINLNRNISCCYDYPCSNDLFYDSRYDSSLICSGHRAIFILNGTCICLSLWVGIIQKIKKEDVLNCMRLKHFTRLTVRNVTR